MSVCLSCTFSLSLFLPGVVFDRLEGDDIEYTLRLRHEVGELDTWRTNEASFWFQPSGARVGDKLVKHNM